MSWSSLSNERSESDRLRPAEFYLLHQHRRVQTGFCSCCCETTGWCHQSNLLQQTDSHSDFFTELLVQLNVLLLLWQPVNQTAPEGCSRSNFIFGVDWAGPELRLWTPPPPFFKGFRFSWGRPRLFCSFSSVSQSLSAGMKVLLLLWVALVLSVCCGEWPLTRTSVHWTEPVLSGISAFLLFFLVLFSLKKSKSWDFAAVCNI